MPIFSIIFNLQKVYFFKLSGTFPNSTGSEVSHVWIGLDNYLKIEQTFNEQKFLNLNSTILQNSSNEIIAIQKEIQNLEKYYYTLKEL